MSVIQTTVYYKNWTTLCGRYELQYGKIVGCQGQANEVDMRKQNMNHWGFGGTQGTIKQKSDFLANILWQQLAPSF